MGLSRLRFSHRMIILIAVFVIKVVAMGLTHGKDRAEMRVRGPLDTRIVQIKDIDIAGDLIPPSLLLGESYLTRYQNLNDSKIKVLSVWTTTFDSLEGESNQWHADGIASRHNHGLLIQMKTRLTQASHSPVRALNRSARRILNHTIGSNPTTPDMIAHSNWPPSVEEVQLRDGAWLTMVRSAGSTA